MKNKKIKKRIAVLLSVLILLIEICLYIKMNTTWLEIGSNHHQYENASLIIVGLFRYGTLIWGLLLIPLVWLEYFLMKIYSEFENFKRLFLCLVIVIVTSTILVFFIKILLLIAIALMQ